MSVEHARDHEENGLNEVENELIAVRAVLMAMTRQRDNLKEQLHNYKEQWKRSYAKDGLMLHEEFRAWKTKHLNDEAADVRTEVEPLKREVLALRMALWLNHGHRGIYGDDGEMQCSECYVKYGMGDYKRDTVERVAETFIRALKELP